MSEDQRANHQLREALSHGPDCPAWPELIAGSNQVEAHLKSCIACQTELALLQRFEAEPETAAERAAVRSIVRQLKAAPAGQVPEPKRERSWQRLFTPAWMGGAALAAAAVVFAFGIGSQWRAQHAHTDLRGETEQMRSRTVEVTSPYGELSKLPGEITWKPVENAASYGVRLSEVDGTVLIYKNVTSCSFILPLTVTRLVKPGKTVQFTVSAFSSSGNTIAGSGALPLHVAAEKTDSHQTPHRFR